EPEPTSRAITRSRPGDESGARTEDASAHPPAPTYALGGSGDRQKPEKNPEKKTEENPERAEPSVCAAPEDKTKKTAQTWAGSVRCPVDAGSADGAPPSTRADLLCPLRGQPATDR